MSGVAGSAVRIRHDDFRSNVARGIHVVIAMVMSAIVLLGFWPFYAGLFTGGTGAHWVIYLHAAVFTGWMVLLMTQVTLVYRRRVGAHQRVGRLGIYYGLLMLFMGLAVTIAAPVQSVVAGRSSLDEAAGFLILPIGDMLLFAGFFIAGIVYRRKKELHKRLMVLATVALLFAPAARLGGDIGPLAVLAIWLLPLSLALVHDAVVLRRVERVYMIGVVVLLIAFARIGLMQSEGWLTVGRRLIMVFMPTEA